EPVRDVRMGQVISYRIPIGDHHVQTHRVIKVLHTDGNVIVQTKGDANTAPDPWKAELHGTTAWQVRAVGEGEHVGVVRLGAAARGVSDIPLPGGAHSREDSLRRESHAAAGDGRGERRERDRGRHEGRDRGSEGGAATNPAVSSL